MYAAAAFCQIDMAGDFCYIAALVGNTFHISNHAECSTDGTQIVCYRLLLQKKFHTQCLYFPLLYLGIAFDLCSMVCHFSGSSKQSLCRICNAVFALCAHEYKTVIQLFQLTVEFCTHFIRTSR